VYGNTAHAGARRTGGIGKHQRGTTSAANRALQQRALEEAVA
jgi:hypothetical protein